MHSQPKTGCVKRLGSEQADTPTNYSLASIPCPWTRDLQATAGAPFHPLSLTAWANSVPARASPVIPSSISTVQAIVSEAPDRPNNRP